MQQLRDYGDQRQRQWCIHCGSTETSTRDHLPSRVFLDEPYPENLAVVQVCATCNSGFSKDEQFVACLIECDRAGTATPERLDRPKVRRILTETPSFARSIADVVAFGRGLSAHRTLADARVRDVVIKLARGHALYDLDVPCFGTPSSVAFGPLIDLRGDAREQFETPPRPRLWPEVGTRAMQRFLVVESHVFASWVEVQDGRYRYVAIQGSSDVVVRLVVGEYMAAEVRWVGL